MAKKALKARDIERLENTSMASVLLPTEPAPEVLPLQILGETEGCTNSCGECTCGCVSWVCCATGECDATLRDCFTAIPLTIMIEQKAE